MYTLGTGVGGGVVIDGHDLPRRHGPRRRARPRRDRARTGRECPGNCPNRGCMEALCSGLALERDATSPGSARSRQSPLGRIGAEHGKVPGRDVVAAARDGRPRRASSCSSSSAPGSAWASPNAINIFEPEAIVIGGGLSRARRSVPRPRAIEEADRARPAGAAAESAPTSARGGAASRRDRRGAARRAGDSRGTRYCTTQHSDRRGPMTPPRDRHASPRRALRQHDPHAVDGRGAEGQLGPSGRADGAGAARVRALHARDAAQPARTRTGPTATASCSRAGHASMLLYSSLYLTGYGADARRPEELPPARQPRPPATPSTSDAPGVEATTGPLGQGIAQRGRPRARPSGCSPRASTARATRSSTTTPS